jgi:predicted enzyme related to lactoylglutathione lyase
MARDRKYARQKIIDAAIFWQYRMLLLRHQKRRRNLMKPSNFVLFYVKDPLASAAFYEKLLGTKAVESSPGFAMFVLPGGFKLGLWLDTEIQPAATGQIGGAEIMFDCDNDEGVDAVHADWSAKGAKILQAPTAMDFGYTFTAADPDGHRLRVYHVAANPM